ncbi:MAG: hypothetical protein H5T83_14060 [Actinotalea sp.]|nr:hypothetical protein [Actinotalea sp.]
MAALVAPHDRRTVVLHGTHPTLGVEVTWRITPLPVDSRGHANYAVTWAVGDLTGRRSWAGVRTHSAVLSTDGLREVVRLARRTG